MGKGLLRVAALAGLAMLALACTSAQPSGSGSGTSTTPKAGGVFNTPATDDPFDYDMTITGSSNQNPYVIKEAYDSLLRFKTDATTKYSDAIVQPNLADSWEVSPDVTTYTFHLKKGIKWATMAPLGGRELTSADVKWTYEYTSRTGPLAAQFKDKKLPVSRYDFFFEGLDSFTAPDPYTIVIKFKEAFAPFLSYAASSDNPIMPKEIYEKEGNFQNTIVGSGPFQLDSANSQKGSKVVMKKNPDYFIPGRPFLDTINMIVMKEETTRQAAFQTKQVDYYVGSRDASVAKQVQQTVPDAQVITFSNTPYIFAMNFKRKPFDNINVRKAVSLAIDRDEMIKTAAGGAGAWALSFSNVRDDLFTQDEIKSFVKYDPEQAKKILADAGFAGGISAEAIYNTDTDSSFEVAGPLLQAQLKKVGVNLTLKPLPSTEMTLRRRAFDCDICFLSEAQRADLDGQLFLAAKTGGPSNYYQIADPKADELILAQRKEGDPTKRTAILKQAIKYLNESGDATPTWRTVQTILVQPYIHDFFQNADWRTAGSIVDTWNAK